MSDDRPEMLRALAAIGAPQPALDTANLRQLDDFDLRAFVRAHEGSDELSLVAEVLLLREAVALCMEIIDGKLAKMEQVRCKLDVLEKKVNRTYKPNVRRRHQRKR